MEKKYFIKLDNNQEGPFSIDQLKSMNLTDEYDYWTNEFPFWRKITDFDELKDFILILPPKIINLKEIEIEESSTKLKKTLTLDCFNNYNFTFLVVRRFFR